MSVCRRKVIIDLDVGTDDAWALLILLKNAQRYDYEVLAITCVHGNTTVENVVENVLTILSVMGRADIPVFQGAHEPLMLPEKPRSIEYFHGANGLCDIPFGITAARTPLGEEHAVEALKRLLRLHEGTVDMICIGPLTNLALGIKMYPDLAGLVSNLYIMGGNQHGVGNVTCSAEFNFYADPEAAHIVLRQMRCPTTIVPWELCQRLSKLLPMAWRMEVLGCETRPDITPQSCEILRILNAVERKAYGDMKFWMPCDAFLVAVFIRPDSVLTDLRYPVGVELQGALTRGQMVTDHGRPGQGHVRVIDCISEITFRELCLRAID